MVPRGASPSGGCTPDRGRGSRKANTGTAQQHVSVFFLLQEVLFRSFAFPFLYFSFSLLADNFIAFRAAFREACISRHHGSIFETFFAI